VFSSFSTERRETPIMKIISVEIPKVLDYYVSEKYRELLKDKCKNGYCEIPADNSHLLYTVIDYDPDVLAMLNFYASKVERNTIGDMFKYEYELDVEATTDDKDFILTTDTDSTIIGTIENFHMDGNSTIVIIFKIK
jgi:hypothetical protein